MKPKILVITPTGHIDGVNDVLESFAEVSYLDDPSLQEVLEVVHLCDYIFTNPNKSKVFLGKDIFDAAASLKCICTASTGTNHIDKEQAASRDIQILSLTEEREIINKIGSTAELAFALTLASVRKILPSHQGALKGQWDYSKFIGRQMNALTVGVIGFGRLGKFYASFFEPFNSKVVVYDPFKKVNDYEQMGTLEELVSISDIISLHVHVNEETKNLVDKDLLSFAKPDLLIVNTSRGEVVNENDLIDFLKKNKEAKLATDVLHDEIRNKAISPILNFSKITDQILVTQHIGGMTKEAQVIAYGHAAKLLRDFHKTSNR